MNERPAKLTLDQWSSRYAALAASGLAEPAYGGPLHRHVQLEGDLRLRHLVFDNSAAALRLWNFLLTENRRLEQARARGDQLVGAMKDLGTVPVMAFALPGLRAFYPDGAWWTPCLMECSDGLLPRAESLGIDASFCPVRAMLAAFEYGGHFPIPDLLICSAGAVCDDFSAIAQRLQHLGHPIEWWEMPRRRPPEPGEPAVDLPGGSRAPRVQVDFVAGELSRLAELLGKLAGRPLDDELLGRGIRRANSVRRLLASLRSAVYDAETAPLPALEMLIAEMLAIHFCSDLDEARAVLAGLLEEVQARKSRSLSPLDPAAARIYWVNPVADFRAMNWLEEWGGRICGSDYMFTHALDEIPEDLPPREALARIALADPMVGSAQDRARRILRECRAARAEAVVVSRVPGASHSAYEGAVLRRLILEDLNLPVAEIEVPPLSDALQPNFATRVQAVIEAARARR